MPPRSSQYLHPAAPPVPPRPAATLLLLRDSAQGPEVLLTRRSPHARFVPNAYVFPGGRTEAADAQAHGLGPHRVGQTETQRTHALAAIRETFEEVGILLARHPDGQWVSDAQVRSLSRHEPLYPQCEARGWRLAIDAVHELAHWITGRHLPIRFDVPFLVAQAPADQEAVADEQEQFEPVWIGASEALARHRAGQFHMIHPTIYTLQWLEKHHSVTDVLAACSSNTPLWRSCPRTATRAGHSVHVMEHEPAFGELALVCPDGQAWHALEWQSERPVPLLRHLQRLTAPNGGFMTGPGTNSYIVGDRRTGYVVIDPGPKLLSHQERLWQACHGHLRAIVCTHSHPDHSPGAAVLQAHCVANGLPAPPILGLPHGPHAPEHSHFQPDHTVTDGETWCLQDPLHPEHHHTLRFLHTPGHTANHLCICLEEDGLLFSGDHILNGSSTVVAPPDGNMQDYLDSLERLHTLCQEKGVEFILPAHGHVLGDAVGALQRQTQHRLAREAKVAAAIARCPQGDLDDWLPWAYDDVPPRVWPVAKHSLRAHVERLQAMGLVKKG